MTIVIARESRTRDDRGNLTVYGHSELARNLVLYIEILRFAQDDALRQIASPAKRDRNDTMLIMEILHSKKLAKEAAASPTQQYLDVAEIKEDALVLKNGALRAILAVSSINFDLKSTSEQEAIINSYQNFLNSVDFPLQILITSRKLSMENYLAFLTEKEKNQPNELLRFQIAEYKNFINQLVSVSNIMDKNFYIIVPFSPIENAEKGFFSNIGSLLNPQKNILEKRENFETYKSQLFQRVDHIIAGLSGIGLRITPLKTQEIIELLFNAYNPSVFSSIKLAEREQLELK